ncbi:MAG: hypothetical protein CMK92_01760 [Pseudomonas sp.]|nr:hypothetical protein [Pseudomonas sp.]|tara:strand:+ start:921 stop:1289 length:369 start_codon:yes stop_codon:yes gene_type:complete
MPTPFYYNKFFNKEELKAMRRLNRLDAKKLPLSCVAGFFFSILVPVLLAILSGSADKELYFVVGYISSAAGILVARSIFSWIDEHVDRQFSQKWDVLFYERSGQTPEAVADWQKEVVSTDIG